MIKKLLEPRFEGAQLIIETSNETEVYDSQFLVAALLVSVAKGDGHISEMETDKMLQLVGEHFHLRSSESLELLTRAMSNLAENPDLSSLLVELSTVLTSADKEDVAATLFVSVWKTNPSISITIVFGTVKYLYMPPCGSGSKSKLSES